MNKYLLTILGDFETLENCKNIALSITPVVDSPNLKFQYDKGVLIFHFSSEIPKEEIFEYVRGILYGISDSFILTPMSDDVSVSMPQDRYNHLFDLESSDGDMDMKLNMERIKNNLDFMEEVYRWSLIRRYYCLAALRDLLSMFVSFSALCCLAW